MQNISIFSNVYHLFIVKTLRYFLETLNTFTHTHTHAHAHAQAVHYRTSHPTLQQNTRFSFYSTWCQPLTFPNSFLLTTFPTSGNHFPVQLF